MRRRDALLLLALAAGVLAIAAVLLRGVAGMLAAAAVVALLVGGRVAGWTLRGWTWRRLPPDAPPGAGRLRLRAGGSFTWEPPAAPPRFPTGGDLVRHRWWDADAAPRHHAVVEVEVPDAAVGRPLARATRRALRSASRALPGRGRVRASATVRDKAGPTSLVRARIEVRGVGADGAWAQAAARAFAERLRRELE